MVVKPDVWLYSYNIYDVYWEKAIELGKVQ